MTTGEAKNISASGATLTASFSDIPVPSDNLPQNVVFKYGTSKDNLENIIGASEVVKTSDGSLTAVLDELASKTTYWYQASMDIWDETSGGYVTISGEIISFQTLPTAETGYQRGYYELPYMDAVKSGEYLVSSSNPNNYYAYHMCAGGETYSFNGKQITARNYTVCFSGEDHVAYWVAAPRHAMYEGTGRHESYKADPSIPSDLQYRSKDTGAGCNKGHILGSAERNSTVETNHQVFYYSNIAPQLEDGFNTGGGGWNKLEDWVDKQVCSDTLYQVVGCYFKDYTDGYGNRVSAKTISFGGRTDVSFPTMFYYVLIRTKKGNSGKALKDCSADELKCAAFVRAHTNNLAGQDVTSTEMMSVAELEKITGFTYFANVPNAPKSTAIASDWGL